MSEEKRRYSLFSKSLKSCVDPLMRPVLKAKGIAASKLIAEWESIVGRELAAHTLPVSLNFPKDKNSEGTLGILCEGAYALTFQHMQPVIIERIASYFGYRAVARITIEQRPLSINRTVKKDVRIAPPKRIDMSCIDKVEDEELKTALSELAKTISGLTITKT